MLEILMIVIAIGTGAKGEVVSATPLATSGDAVEAKSFTGAEELPPGYKAPEVAAPRPLPYTAEQQVATGRFTTALEVKPILNVTRANWIAVREFNGQDLVYVTHLWAWRCGLVAIRYAVNDDPLETWPLPECHEDTNSPNAMLDGDGLPYREYGLGTVQTVTVELIYDDLTTDKATFNRQGAMIP